jgi:F-box-like
MQKNHSNGTPGGGELQDLPPELAIQILRECVPRVMHREGRRFFLPLRTLCSQWRDICYKTPEFWSNLAIDFDQEKDTGGKVKQILQSSREWLNRSGLGANLELFIAEEAAFSKDGAHLFVQFIQDHASRWKRLELDVSDPVLMYVMVLPSARQPNLWPALQSLQVKMQGRWVETRFLNLMQSLRRLRIELIPIDIPMTLC